MGPTSCTSSPPSSTRSRRTMARRSLNRPVSPRPTSWRASRSPYPSADQRFVDTGTFAARSDNIVGLEAAGIFKSLHLAAEGQYLMANGYDAGDRVTSDTSEASDVLNVFPAATQYVSNGNPSFWGGYVEAGYFLTGELAVQCRRLDRTNVLSVQQGGIGASSSSAGRRLASFLKLLSGHHNFVTGLASPRGSKRAGWQARPLAGPDLDPRVLYSVLVNTARQSGRAPWRDGRPTTLRPNRARSHLCCRTVQRSPVDFLFLVLRNQSPLAPSRTFVVPGGWSPARTRSSSISPR